MLKEALHFSIAFNATLSFPKPCEILAHLHSKEIANCSYGWDYYIKSDHYFVGFHGSDNTTFYKAEDVNTTSLTVEVLDSLERPPPGPFIFIVWFEFYKAVENMNKAIHRFIKYQHIPDPKISFQTTDMVIRKADLLMQSFNIDGDAYGVIKIRRKDRESFLHCTEPKAVLSKFNDFYQTLNGTERRLPWLVFGYVEHGYWARLAEEIFLSPSLQKSHYPRLLFERDMHIDNTEVNIAFADNYIMMQIILHLMYTARYSIGTYYYEGKNGHFCEHEEV